MSGDWNEQLERRSDGLVPGYIGNNDQAAPAAAITGNLEAIVSGLAAARPAANSYKGWYFSTDTGALDHSDGAAWTAVQSGTSAPTQRLSAYCGTVPTFPSGAGALVPWDGVDFQVPGSLEIDALDNTHINMDAGLYLVNITGVPPQGVAQPTTVGVQFLGNGISVLPYDAGFGTWFPQNLGTPSVLQAQVLVQTTTDDWSEVRIFCVGAAWTPDYFGLDIRRLQ